MKLPKLPTSTRFSLTGTILSLPLIGLGRGLVYGGAGLITIGGLTMAGGAATESYGQGVKDKWAVRTDLAKRHEMEVAKVNAEMAEAELHQETVAALDVWEKGLNEQMETSGKAHPSIGERLALLKTQLVEDRDKETKRHQAAMLAIAGKYFIPSSDDKPMPIVIDEVTVVGEGGKAIDMNDAAPFGVQPGITVPGPVELHKVDTPVEYAEPADAEEEPPVVPADDGPVISLTPGEKLPEMPKPPQPPVLVESTAAAQS